MFFLQIQGSEKDHLRCTMPLFPFYRGRSKRSEKNSVQSHAGLWFTPKSVRRQSPSSSLRQQTTFQRHPHWLAIHSGVSLGLGEPWQSRITRKRLVMLDHDGYQLPPKVSRLHWNPDASVTLARQRNNLNELKQQQQSTALCICLQIRRHRTRKHGTLLLPLQSFK